MRSEVRGESVMMNRRQLFRTGAGVVTLIAARRGRADEGAARVMTVLGPIDPGRMGLTLPHEHVLVDVIRAERVFRDR
jgi:hypothetical protein